MNRLPPGDDHTFMRAMAARYALPTAGTITPGDGLDHLVHSVPDAMDYPRTFSGLLQTLSLMDQDVALGVDPDAVTGDLRDKVDALKWRMDQWKAELKALQEDWIAPLLARKASLEKRIKAREEYIRDAMLANDFTEIHGHLFRVQIQPNKPAVVTTIPADETTFIEHGAWMRVETTFAWDKEAIKAALDSGGNIPFASLKQGKSARFYPNAKAPKRKKKP